MPVKFSFGNCFISALLNGDVLRFFEVLFFPVDGREGTEERVLGDLELFSLEALRLLSGDTFFVLRCFSISVTA